MIIFEFAHDDFLTSIIHFDSLKSIQNSNDVSSSTYIHCLYIEEEYVYNSDCIFELMSYSEYYSLSSYIYGL